MERALAEAPQAVCSAPGSQVEALAGVAHGVVDPAEQAEAGLAEGARRKPFISRRFRAVGLNFVKGRLKASPYSPGRR